MNERPKDIPQVYKEPKRYPFLVDILIRLVKEKPLGTIGGAIVGMLFITGIFADLLAPYGMNEVRLVDMLLPPSARHILGTDQLGRDIISNIIYGARISMIIGVCASTIDIIVATTIGALTGFIGGKLDMVVQRFVDAWMSFPSLLLIMTLISIVGQGMVQIIVLIGVSHGIRSSRVVRSAVISIKGNVYVEAA